MQINDMTRRERAALCRRMGLDRDCDDATLAAFLGAELTADRGERVRLKQRAIERAAHQGRRRRGLWVVQTPAQQLDASGSYPRAWLAPPQPPPEGRVTHGSSGRTTLRSRVTKAP
jgi:hypothetical protein